MRFVLAFLIFATPCAAQSHDQVAAGVLASASIADWVTTHRVINAPDRLTPDGLHRVELYEANPLLGWAEGRPALMYAAAAGLDAAGIYAWFKVTKNHRKMRTVGLYAAAAARFAIAYRNHRMVRRHAR